MLRCAGSSDSPPTDAQPNGSDVVALDSLSAVEEVADTQTVADSLVPSDVVLLLDTASPADAELVDAELSVEVDATIDTGDADSEGPDTTPLEPVDVSPVDATDATFDPGPDPCGEVLGFGPVFDADLATFAAEDATYGWPADALVFVGSSSIRRWETLTRVFSDYTPIQRGIGGAQLGEIALRTSELVTKYNPRAVVVYAGTNDLAAGVLPDVVLGRLKCLRWRVGSALGWDRPVFAIGVTPNPARWADWPVAAAYNASVAALAAVDPGLTYIDGAPPFLATGAPPAAGLFDPDGLHLSPAGYALWESGVRPAITAELSASPTAGSPAISLGAGTRVLIDLGPTNPEDGEVTPSPDYLGHHWNNWHAIHGGDDVLAGEALGDLVTTTGAPTGIDLVIAGGFLVNGRQSGGLLWPSSTLLGDLAVGSATGDFFYVQNADAPGALMLRGLDPAATYTLRLFGSRDHTETRITRYTVYGASEATQTVQTTGPAAGATTPNGNDDTVISFPGVQPDAWGNAFIDVAIEEGSYAYVSLIELVVH